MNIKAVAVAALLGIATPGAVFAQAANPSTPDPAGGAKANTSTMNGETSSMGLNADFDTFIKGFEGADFTNVTSGIGASSTFKVVKISTLKNADMAKLKGAIDPQQKDVANLDTNLGANPAAKAALDAAGVPASAVVWVATDADGSATIYVNDAQQSHQRQCWGGQANALARFFATENATIGPTRKAARHDAFGTSVH